MNHQGFFLFGRSYRGLYSRLSQPIKNIIIGGCVGGVAAIILLPVFCQSREKYRPYCMSNEKQVGLGILQYVQDYDEEFPVGTRSNRMGLLSAKDTPRQAKYHAGQGWAGTLWPYIKNDQVFQCPFDPSKTDGELTPVSYSYNRNMALNVKTSKLNMPAVTVLLAEIEGDSANVRDAEERTTANTYSTAGNGLTVLAAADGENEVQAAHGTRYVTGVLGGYGKTPGCAAWQVTAPHQSEPRHEGRANYVLADGHAKYFKPDVVSPGDNALTPTHTQDCTNRRAVGTHNFGTFGITFSTK